MTNARGTAVAGASTELLRHRGEGTQSLRVDVETTGANVLLAMLRTRDGAVKTVPLSADTSNKKTDTGYVKDGSTTDFSAQTLAGPVMPGSFLMEATTASPAVKDHLRDGNLYLDGLARHRAASGSFAAMASESMTVKIDGKTTTIITFGTEATIGAAVVTINAALRSGSAVAQGAEDVDLLSDSTGPLSSVEVTAADAGVTTKLGISVGASTALAGTLNYFTGALTLTMPGGYAPAVGGGSSGAFVDSTNAAPYNFDPAMTLIVDTDVGGDETATFDAAAAITTGSSGSFAAMASETMDVTIDGGDTVTVTFGTEATIELAVALINEQMEGGFADQVDANNARLTSDQKGTGASVVLANVDAAITTKLGIGNGTDNGTGDVADINAVTGAEIKTVVEADTTGLTVTSLGDGTLRFSAVTSVNFNATSTAEAIVGVDTVLHSSSAGDAPLLADWITTTQFSGKSNAQLGALSELDELSIEATGSARAQLSASVDPLS